MKFLLIVLFFISGCGYFEEDKPTPNIKITNEQKEALINMRSNIESWVRECSAGITCGTKSNGVAEDGDSMLWAGLLCLSGEDDQCEAAKLSVGSDGSLHRNPDQDRTENSFSRDMMMGFLAYLSASGDKVTGDLAHNFIIENDHKLCLDADNNRCDFQHPTYNAGWGIWYEIWKKYDYAPTAHMKTGANYGGEFIINVQSIFATEGYPRHLVAVELMLHQSANNWTYWMQNSANQLVKFQPKNPFFEYVANGPTRRAAQLTLDKCPLEQPQPASNDWAWQRDESEEAWKEAKGWDCIFMANILLGDRK